MQTAIENRYSNTGGRWEAAAAFFMMNGGSRERREKKLTEIEGKRLLCSLSSFGKI